MIRIDTVERVAHCGHIRRFDEASVRIGDLLWHHQVMGERDVALCRRLADQMGLEFVDLRGQKTNHANPQDCGRHDPRTED